MSKIYHTLELKKGGSTVKVRFQELPAARQNEAIAFYINQLVKDDVLVKAAGVAKSDGSLKEYQKISESLFEHDPPKIIMCCIEDGSDNGGQLLGINVLMKGKSTDSTEDFAKLFSPKTPEMKTLFNLWAIVDTGMSDTRKKFDIYFTGPGTLILSEYKGLGIAEELLKISETECTKHKLPMIVHWLTTVENQQAAEKNNWQTAAKFTPEELEKKCNVTFEDNKTPIKIVYKIIN